MAGGRPWECGMVVSASLLSVLAGRICNHAETATTHAFNNPAAFRHDDTALGPFSQLHSAKQA